MTADEHKKRHEELHGAFDELVADFCTMTEGLPSKTNLVELMKWSHKQSQEPDHAPGNEGGS